MLFPEKIHRYLYIFGLAILLCALPFSKFLLSVGLFTVAINWLLEGQWRNKLLSFKSRKSLWIFLLVYISVLISFFYSNNTSYALKELKLWLPLLLLPIIVVTSIPLKKKEFLFLLLFFCLTVFVSTVISFYLYVKDYQNLGQDLRYLSPFISHIRFSLMINLAIFILVYIILSAEYFNFWGVKLFLGLLLFWFVLFLFVLQSFTGIIILLCVSIILIFFWLIRVNNSVFRFWIITFFSAFILLIASYLAHEVNSFFNRNLVDFKNLPKVTKNGNPYTHDTINREYENSNLVWVNICSVELKQGWDRFCALYPSSKNKEFSNVEFGLIRYLTSKGLKKDSVGISKLDSIDFVLINNNVSSVIYREQKFGIYPRLYQLLWEIDKYRNTNNPNGSSLFQRYVYVKSSWAIIKKNFFFGVGVGDGKDQLMNYYSSSNVNLNKQYWFISHNQYLTVWIASGLIGLILFVVGFIIPVFIERKAINILSIAFLSIIMISMFTEDTLETHIGITFTALFYSLIIFGRKFPIDEQNGL